MEITFGGTLTEVEYRHAQRVAAPAFARHLGWFLLALLGVAIWANGGIGPIVHAPAAKGMPFLPGIIIIIMAFTAPRRAASRMWRSNERLREPVRAMARGDELQWSTPSHSATHRLPEIYAIKTFDDVALLYVDAHEVLIAPRRYFADEDWPRFRELLARHQ